MGWRDSSYLRTGNPLGVTTLAEKTLVSDQYEAVDLDDAIELCYRKGWTDGLPVVPPTEEKVRRFLAAAGREPDEALGFYTTRRRLVTVEKVAINAVMAGCLPEYFPVVLAIVEAMLEEEFNIHLGNASTGGAAIGFIFNGPIRQRLGMNWHGNVMGPGNRANSTIGRAVRLTQINVMGSVPGAGGADEAGRMLLDRSTLGQPGKYAGYHIVENEEDYPSLTPLHVELGFSRESSAVTVFATSGHVQVSLHAENTGDQIIDSLAQYMVGTGRLTHTGFCVVVLAPENVEYLVRDGWTKADIRKALFERTTRTVAWVKREGWPATMFGGRGGTISPVDEERKVAIAASPSDIHVVVSGGPAGGFTDFLLPFGYSQSREIRT